MNAAIFVSDGDARDNIAASLRSQGSRVLVLDALESPNETLFEQLCAFRPDVMFIGDAMRTICEIRRWSLPIQPYIIAVPPKMTGRHISRAAFAGADDVMRKTASSEEVVFRAEGPTRMGTRYAQHQVARESTDALLAWKGAEELLADALAEDFSASCQIAEATTQPKALAASIDLTDVERGSVVRILVALPSESVWPFSRIACAGECDEERRRDALREITNLAAGRLKRVALEEGKHFSIGLPTDADAVALDSADKTWSISCRGMTLDFGLRRLSKVARRLRTVDLRPGMVLKNDIRNFAGIPFVRSGSAVTERTIEKIVDFCGDTTSVDVWLDDAA